MGQILAKICGFIKQRSPDHEVTDRLLLTQECSHITDLPKPGEDHVKDTQLVNTIPEENRSKTKKSKDNKNNCILSFGSAIGGALNLKLVDNVTEQKTVRAEMIKAGKTLRHYCTSHKILLVGEGDFSFSVCLAKALGSAANMFATSLDSRDFLMKNYPSATTNIGYLKKRGCILIHNVDATKMANHPKLNGKKFDRIVFNFPLVGFFKKQQLKRNKSFVSMFMRNAKEMIEKDGEILITHKTSASYRKWDIENLANQNGLKLIEDEEFNLHHYPGYHTKYGFGGNEDFNCYPSKIYKFGLE